ncbi:cytochrome c biogenesis protein ResB [Geobacter grbiciae]|uniref:cytochrome c biogenesis protein ResB n=1 Tax=Geobacter grbiciae TaxID=155042 RepID=UPI001C0274CF|nr:cytochrome c biogenesis protein ResB [Geobacter grbiciae]MBT1074223.1 cytochrome c biogenesis protein ResB [Geobacter grbiciae]
MPADMLKSIKTFFTARFTVMALLLLFAASLTVANIVPQSGALQPGGGMGQPVAEASRSFLVNVLGLHHVFSTWWFVALSALFVISLLFSTVEQFRISRARMFQLPFGGGVVGGPCVLSAEQVQKLLGREGYRRFADGPGGTRYVKASVGHWGSFLLHFGMTLTVLCVLIYVLTEHRVIVRAVAGERIVLKEGGYAERRGLLGRSLPLPAAIALVRLEPEFWEEDQLKALTSNLVFFDRHNAPRDIQVALSHKKPYRGLIVYQQSAFGNAFLLKFRGGPSGGFDKVLHLPMPPRRDRASYGTFPLDEGRYILKAKYYANADKSRIMPDTPQLILRLYDGEQFVAETSLSNDQAVPLGPYTVRLAGINWWTDILFEGSRGTAGIFTGFALLLCGGVLAFFIVPREVVLRRTEAGYTVSWRATRFPEFYREEGDRILALCKGEEKR